jgi:acetyl-CoA decarbonylase/synthase complex subunit gamma
MSKKISPLDVFNLLPKTNCGECGEDTCFAFATKVADRKLDLEQCIPLYQESQYKEKKDKLEVLLRPAVREIRLQSKDDEVRIGGKTVVYRHEFRYSNPTAIAITVSDTMPEDIMLAKVKKASDWEYRYIGMDLSLDLIAIRSSSNDPIKFRECVVKVSDVTNMPIVLCSFNPEVIEQGLIALKGQRPLIFAANQENWEEMAALSKKYECPIVVSAPNDLNQLRLLTISLMKEGIEDIVLDPGTLPDEGLRDTLNNFTMLRRSAIQEQDDLSGFPLLGTPISAWGLDEEEPEIKAWKESYISSILLSRYADILIINNMEMWSILPVVIWRTNIYTDPVKPVTVEPGLRTFGTPDENSPVLYTTNFALTYYTVQEDVKDLDCYMLVVDTEGISVESAVAGGKLTADKVKDTIDETGIEDMVTHRKIVSPGLAARISGETEMASNWDVLVGPKDSAGVKSFLDKNFYKERT